MNTILRDKFIGAGIPYDSIDKEMIEILDVLNFGLGIRTRHCCIGHSHMEKTTIMFEKDVSDEDMYMLISVVDSNVGSAGVKGVRLSKWLRMIYGLYYKKPHYPVQNWVLEIRGVEDEELRVQRLNKITEELKKLFHYDKSKVG